MPLSSRPCPGSVPWQGYYVDGKRANFIWSSDCRWGPLPGSVWSVTVAVVRGLTVRWRPTLSFTLPDARITLTAEPHRCSRLFRLDRVALPSGGEAAISLGTSGLSPSGGPGFVPRVGVESSGSERHLGFAARGTLTLSGRCKRLRRSYSRSGDV